MDTELLVVPDAPGARRLLAALEKRGTEVVAAFWREPVEGAGWRLVISSPAVDAEGLRPIYRSIQDVLRDAPDIRLSLDQITPVGPSDPIVAMLRANEAVLAVYPTHQITVPVAGYSPYVPDDAAFATLDVVKLLPGDRILS